jgi:hypothetical protein
LNFNFNFFDRRFIYFLSVCLLKSLLDLARHPLSRVSIRVPFFGIQHCGCSFVSSIFWNTTLWMFFMIIKFLIRLLFCYRSQFTEYIQKNVALYQFCNGIPLTTATTASFTRGELATALRKVFISILGFYIQFSSFRVCVGIKR